jgi:hypothetical protein
VPLEIFMFRKTGRERRTCLMMCLLREPQAWSAVSPSFRGPRKPSILP